MHGDVYFSEEAIQKIINTKVKDTMFFCVRDVHDGRPTGINTKGREPLAYKVQNQKIFRKAINELKEMVDDGKFLIDPISWNLYRQINNMKQDYNAKDYGYAGSIFFTEGDYVAIDDYTTDIDNMGDIEKLERLIRITKGGEEMIKVKATAEFHLSKFNELRNIQRVAREENGKIFKGDIFECTKEMADYLCGDNKFKTSFVEVVEVIPEKEEIKEKVEAVEEKIAIEEKPVEKPKRATRKTKSGIAKRK